ncbi:hypothetical protein BC830DRAFT_266850 [Chytriomyces sp. MP71]|nr:hypothetical protein BC830DRAFT_266850 [Chytriomyces sp. MP71]
MRLANGGNQSRTTGRQEIEVSSSSNYFFLIWPSSQMVSIRLIKSTFLIKMSSGRGGSGGSSSVSQGPNPPASSGSAVNPTSAVTAHSGSPASTSTAVSRPIAANSAIPSASPSLSSSASPTVRSPSPNLVVVAPEPTTTGAWDEAQAPTSTATAWATATSAAVSAVLVPAPPSSTATVSASLDAMAQQPLLSTAAIVGIALVAVLILAVAAVAFVRGHFKRKRREKLAKNPAAVGYEFADSYPQGAAAKSATGPGPENNNRQSYSSYRASVWSPNDLELNQIKPGRQGMRASVPVPLPIPHSHSQRHEASLSGEDVAVNSPVVVMNPFGEDASHHSEVPVQQPSKAFEEVYLDRRASLSQHAPVTVPATPRGVPQPQAGPIAFDDVFADRRASIRTDMPPIPGGARSSVLQASSVSTVMSGSGRMVQDPFEEAAYSEQSEILEVYSSQRNSVVQSQDAVPNRRDSFIDVYGR